MKKDDILSRVSAIQIFEHFIKKSSYYHGERIQLNKRIRSPLAKEKTPSFFLFQKNGEIFFKDHGRGDSGDCFTFVQTLHSCDFKGALHLVATAFGISKTRHKRQQQSLSLQSTTLQRFVLPELPTRSDSIVEYESKAFSTREIAYWNSFGITDLRKVLSIEQFTFRVTRTRKCVTVFSTPDNPIFCFTFQNNGLKFYRPFADKSKYEVKFCANTSQEDDIYGWDLLPEGRLDYGILTGGNKDVLSLNNNTDFHAISLNSEGAKLTPRLFVMFKAKFKELVVLYDIDETGVKNAKIIATTFNVPLIDLRILAFNFGDDISMFFKILVSKNINLSNRKRIFREQIWTLKKDIQIVKVGSG